MARSALTHRYLTEPTMSTNIEQQAHEYATQKAMAYCAKFTRPVQAGAVDGIYRHAFGMFLRNHRATS